MLCEDVDMKRRPPTVIPLIVLYAAPWGAFLLLVPFWDLPGFLGTSLLAYTVLLFPSVLLTRRCSAWLGVIPVFLLLALMWAGVACLPPTRGSMMMGPIQPMDLATAPGEAMVDLVRSVLGSSPQRRRARLLRAAARGDAGALGRAPLEELTDHRGRRSILAEAASYGSLEAVRHIVERGADIGPGSDVLSGAAFGGDEATTRWLLERGADPLLPPERCGGGGPHPVSIALGRGHVDVADVLFAAGLERWGTTYANAVLEHAVCRRVVELVDFAVDRGADPAIPARDGQTLLELAVSWAALIGSGPAREDQQAEAREVVRALVQAGLDPEAVTASGESARDQATAAGVLFLFEDLRP
jgi:hypothetical protein